MSLPHLEKGFLRLPNKLCETIYKRSFTAYELRLLLWVIRSSYGWNRKQTQAFGLRRLARELGVNHGSLHSCIKRLIKRGILIRQGSTFQIEKNYEFWDGDGKPAGAVNSPSNDAGLSENRNGLPENQAGLPKDQIGLPQDHFARGLNTEIKTENINTSQNTDLSPAIKMGWRLAEYLRDRIKLHSPKAVQSIDLEGWAEEAAEMIEKDGRKSSEILDVFHFSQGNGFWIGIILSMNKLRKHFDRLQDLMEENIQKERWVRSGNHHSNYEYRPMFAAKAQTENKYAEIDDSRP